MSTDTTPEAWDERLRGTRDAVEAARAVHEQTIRDAHAAGGRRVADITRALGIQNRNRITAVLNPTEDGDVPTPKAPASPVVVYLRAPGFGEGVWDRLRQAMWARGWHAVSDRTTAWHLARGGLTTVYVDLAAQRDNDPITVQLVRAVYSQPLETPEHVPVRNLLPTMESIRFEREHPEAAAWLVTFHEDREPQFKVLAGGHYARPREWDAEATNNAGTKGASRLDVQAVARLVANLLE
ncbi:hypothetical protein OIE69_43780 (plasmid) [Actinacidiphila glaucinigra]|uniref:hypothetical protein n=1 Tax=Actinacidiphila glaucinigra TaxID=235986 RepID=UPI002DD97688|nr:hypothetical protein [Actinacidiphila glaucinigra]WSD65828.1 hypothetical protein OIE69_43780 [Actinacidiphila glaucinigra]